MFSRDVGLGRVTVVAFNAAELYSDALLEDHLSLIGNAVRAGLGGEPAVTVEGAGVLDCASWATASTFTFAFANLTGPMVMRGQQRQVWPLDDLRVTVSLDRLDAAVADAANAGTLRVSVLRNDELSTVDAQLGVEGRLVVDLPETRELGIVHLAW